MGGALADMRCCALAVASAVLLILAAGSTPAAAAADGGKRAERIVRKDLKRASLRSISVKCARARRPARTWRCRWLAVRPAPDGAKLGCTGARRVSRGRLRGKRSSTCRPAPATPGPGPEATFEEVTAGPSKLLGFNDNGVRANQLTAAQDAALTAGAGANLSRVTLDWRWLEATRDVYYFGPYDAIYTEMLARGATPVFILMFAPQWARDADVNCHQWVQDCRYPPAREHYDEWRELVTLVAERYPAAAIEIWNEPNLAAFWQPGPDPARYAELVREASTAADLVNPNAQLNSGALNDVEVNDQRSMRADDYLRVLYQQGAMDAVDAISLNVYPYSLALGPGTHFARAMAAPLAVRHEFGDGDKPVWITETGVSTTGPGAMSGADQAAATVSLYRTLSATEDVEAVMFHTLVEPLYPTSSMNRGFGLVTQGLAPKPAYCALAAERGASGNSACG